MPTIKTPGAVPFLLAVFINAFVDIGHKIMIQNTIFKLYDGPQQVILTAIVNTLILLPFIVLFIPAGMASDKYPKTHIMKLSAWGAIALTLVITLCYARGWFWAAFIMTFLLALQSAFYSPAKYGYIKTLFGQQHLAQGNGLVQSISILAILMGTLVFSISFEYWYQRDALSEGEILTNLVPIGVILVINSIIELLLVYRLPSHTSNEQTGVLAVKENMTKEPLISSLRTLIKTSPSMPPAMLGLAMFWSAGQVLLAVFPAFAKTTLGETNTIIIQAMLAVSGIGIALGSWLAGRLARDHADMRLITSGAIGFAIGLGLLPHLDTYWRLILAFLLSGIAGGCFIVPLNTLIQFYTKADKLGQVLAVNNLVQNLAMLSFLLITVSVSLLAVNPKIVLILMSLLVAIGSSYTLYRLHTYYRGTNKE